MHVVLLAAGFGTRMYPLTEHTAKPLLEVAGKPVLTHSLQRVAELHEVDSITVVANDRFANDLVAWASEATASGVAVVPVEVLRTGASHPDDRNGAVADMAAAMATVGEAGGRSGRWLVLAGDNLWGHSLLGYVRQAGDGNAVVCRDLGAEVPPGRFGEVTVDDHGVVIRFREKPADPQSPLAATCTYLLDGDAPARIAEYLAGDGNADSPGEFIGWLAKRTPVQALTMTGAYWDIGSLDALDRARVEVGLD